MKKSVKFKYFIAGMLVAVILGSVMSPAMAALTGKNITVYSGISVYMDDEKLVPKDVNGNVVDVFSYNGTTYLPVRALSEALGKTVQWDASTSSVYVGKHTGAAPAVWIKDMDTFTGDGFRYETEVVDNLGNTHNNVLSGETTSTYVLNGQYTAISGTLFYRYKYRSSTYDYVGYIEIYGDGDLLYRESVKNGTFPVDFNVDITGVLILEIKMNTRGGFLYSVAGVADLGLWT